MKTASWITTSALWFLVGCVGGEPGGFDVLQRGDIVFPAQQEHWAPVWTQEHAEQVDAIVGRVRDALDVPSFSVAIVHGERLVYAKSFGDRSLSAQTRATPDTLYHVGSVSKPIAATLLMVLIEQGRLGLDDPVKGYLPAHVRLPTFDGEPAELTVRHLATHAAGLPKDPPNRRNVWHGLWLNPGQAKPYSVDALYEALGSTRLRFEPGTACSYSNYGYSLLGHVMERAAGVPLEQLLKQELFKPLGMASSTVSLDVEQRSRFATHYWADDSARPRHDRPATRFGEVFAHGGVVSSVEDLARWVSFQIEGQDGMLSAGMLKMMRQPQPAPDGQPLLLERDGLAMQMCIGWRVQWPDQQGGIINHSGEMDGHSAYVAYAPEAQMGVVVLANLGGARDRSRRPTAALRLGIALKQAVLYRALRWESVPHDRLILSRAGQSPRSQLHTD
ncbi:MAG: serine hydrolase domain-containing protein [Planctomycetota bacterium]